MFISQNVKKIFFLKMFPSKKVVNVNEPQTSNAEKNNYSDVINNDVSFRILRVSLDALRRRRTARNASTFTLNTFLATIS